MTDTTTTEIGSTLHERYAALQAEREATWAPEDLAANARQRRFLEETAVRDAFPEVGDVLEPFVLTEVHGRAPGSGEADGALTLDALVAEGPAVLIFFRFAGCPACNLALPYYEEALLPGLRELGATLVAISPQEPGPLAEIKERHDLAFPVASDRGAELIRRLGIAFTPDPEARAHAERKGNDLGATLGSGRWELPYPTVLVVDQQRTVRFVDVHPDWLIRTEAPAVLDAVRALAEA